MDGSEDATTGWEQSSTTRAPNAASSASLAAGRDDYYCGDADDDNDDLLRHGRRRHHYHRNFLHGDRLLSSSAAGPLRAPTEGVDVSLREWLDQPGRRVDLLECLHIFRQIVEAVNSAHAQGVVVGNVRPSCFVMSPLNRVSFIESASCSTSGSSDSCDDAVGPGRPPRQRKGDAETAQERASGMPSFSVSGEAEAVKEAFPLKHILLMEMNWYTSPEEAVGGLSSFPSDIYRLGVLLFELFYKFDSMEEKLRTMSNLRHRVLPPQLLLKWSKEASFCLWLLHPQPNTRPKMSEVLQSEFLNQLTNSLKERESAIRLREDIEDQELLLDFLLHLQQRKQEVADRLHDIICFLSGDIDEVLKQQSILRQNSFSGCKDEHSTAEKLSLPVGPEIDEGLLSSGSRKRFRPELQRPLEEDNFPSAEGSISEIEKHMQENILTKSARLMKNFKKLEAAYFSTRCRLLKPSRKQINKSFHVTDSGKGSLVRTEVSSIDDMVSREANNMGRNNEWVNPFLEGLCKYLAFSKLKVRADLKQGDLLNSLNLVCSMGFDRDKEFFATAGVNKKIKVFEFDSILNEDRDIQYPVIELANKSKVSCICWNSYIKSQIAASDFDGVVQVWDVTRGQVFSEMREHEKRVWSVDFSLADPTKLASGSDDGAVKLWNINQAGSIGTIRTKANVCTVNFQPDSTQILAVGSADHKIYFYDLRNFRVPYHTLVGHSKTVSYVKYINPSTIVSASTDNSLKLWDLSTCAPRALDNPLQTFLGHTNVKNFVGLSVYDGYIATGSETNEVFVYHKAFPMPVLSYKFNNPDPLSGQELDDASQFVSCVCWRGNSSTLLAASSSGNIKVLEMV